MKTDKELRVKIYHIDFEDDDLIVIISDEQNATTKLKISKLEMSNILLQYEEELRFIKDEIENL